jgi:hypothetical protein
VIEMQVAEQDRDVGGRLGTETVAQGRQAGAGVDDDEALPAADLDAGRMAAELDEARPGRANRPPHAPEPDLQGVLIRGHAP